MTRVLVVDDDESVLNVVAIALRYHGYEVVEAPSGERCLQVLRAGFSGVILMDIMMPGLDGWETIRAAVSENLLQKTLICMMTAKPSPGSEGKGLEQFVFDYLPKPFEHTALFHCVDTAASLLEA